MLIYKVFLHSSNLKSQTSNFKVQNWWFRRLVVWYSLPFGGGKGRGYYVQLCISTLFSSVWMDFFWKRIPFHTPFLLFKISSKRIRCKTLVINFVSYNRNCRYKSLDENYTIHYTVINGVTKKVISLQQTKSKHNMKNTAKEIITYMESVKN